MKKNYFFWYLGLILPFVFSGTCMQAQHWQTNPTTDSLISAYLEEINSDSVENYIQFLEDKGTRFMIAPNRKAVAESIKNKFLLLGGDDARIDSFWCQTNIDYFNLQYDTNTWQYNVIATINGLTDANQCMVMGAHYDDVVTPQGDPMILAPGADDNASGVAALFECVRIFSQEEYLPAYDIEFVAFSAEELMNFGNSGAQAYVDTTLKYGRAIEIMINNDMISYSSSDNWRVAISNHLGNEWLTSIAEDNTLEYTTIDPWVRQSIDQAGADCKYFYEAGVPCVYFMEYNFNPFYHTVNDLVENADMDYCAEVIKISLSTILTVQETTTTGEEEIVALSANVFPNPTNGLVKIKLDKENSSQKAKYIITDVNGRKLFDGELGKGEGVLLNLDGFPEGLYLVSFQSAKAILTKKLVLTRN